MASPISLSPKLTATIDQLRQCVVSDIQSHWFIVEGDRPWSDLTTPSKPAELNDKGYIVWPAGREVRWLTQHIIIPATLDRYPLEGLALRVRLTWWTEDAQIYVNRRLVQAGDLFDSSTRLLLSSSVKPDDRFELALRLVSPGHDIGALMRSSCVYENPAVYNAPQLEMASDAQMETDVLFDVDPGFVADELTVLGHYLSQFAPEKMVAVDQVIAEIDWQAIAEPEQFHQTLSQLRHRLLPHSTFIKQRSFHLLGHAHLDMAWLWPVEETWEVAQRTFESVLTLQQTFPQLRFGHTSAALYQWMERHRPELFQRIQQAVKAGQWEVLGGMWIEPEVNLVAGESLVRQLLYGQQYFQAKFGVIAKIAWLPDSFGFCWQLPQIFKQAGIEAFVTGKLHWNDTTEFPHGLFWWQSPDGSAILTLMAPPNLTGVMDTDPLTMTNYGVRWEQQTGLSAAFWLPGVGDHGGGPTRDMLTVAQKWSRSPFFPTIHFSRAEQYLQPFLNTVSPTAITPEPESKTSELPVWNDELYLELHRGCYTTHADQKQANRRCETLLYQAELWSTLAHLTRCSPTPYPQAELTKAWQQVLFNQFHDILPGTSIPEVFQTANQDWQGVIARGEAILNQALEAIAQHIDQSTAPSPEAIPLVIFNSLNWQRSEVVTLQLPPGQWEIRDHQSQVCLSQPSADQELLFLAPEIPSIGYRLFWLCPVQFTLAAPDSSTTAQENPNPSQTADLAPYILENQYLRIAIDAQSGDISSLWHKTQQQEFLREPGNRLQTFQDQGQYWDAWNIDPDYENQALPSPQLETIEWLETGPIRWQLRVVQTFNHSRIQQDYQLSLSDHWLTIATEIDWQEEHVLLKTAFPLTSQADSATYETVYGAIARPTRPQTPAEQAKWEVPALNWADLSDQNSEYGLSILTDSKYGYDAKPDQLRLTLLRSPRWPDPQADRGHHQFRYALYPHTGDWQTAQTVHHGYEFNLPLRYFFSQQNRQDTTKSSSLPPINQLLHLSASNLILSAFKLPERSEADEAQPQSSILRCYEAYGQPATLTLTGSLSGTIDQRLNLLEQVMEIDVDHEVKPWVIANFSLTFPLL